MAEIDLTADCSRCAALCCVVLPFDKSDAFGFDKAADEPCRHLSGDNRCAIHSQLSQAFSGCVQFDCHGAGQRVSQEVFEGKSWRTEPALLGPMTEAFRAMRKLHEAVLLLQAAERLPLTEAQDVTRQSLIAALEPDRKRSTTELAVLESGQSLKAVRLFLASLREGIRRPRR